MVLTAQAFFLLDCEQSNRQHTHAHAHAHTHTHTQINT